MAKMTKVVVTKSKLDSLAQHINEFVKLHIKLRLHLKSLPEIH